MARARPGFSLEDSVDGVIRISSRVGFSLEFVKFGFVEDRVGNHILFAGPRAEIGEPAAFTAKRKILVEIRVGGPLADGAAMLHGESLSQNAQWRASGDAMELLMGLRFVAGPTFFGAWQDVDNTPDQVVGIGF